MWRTLNGIGLTEKWIHLLQKFNLDNQQFIGRRQVESFLAEVGIRQGCSLSPLLFAVVADLLLRRLDEAIGNNGTVLAFADDAAVILQDYHDLPRIMAIFEEYATFSNLKLNLAKT
eukprot:7621376-Alexandrium_andersonii.AAC.1